VDATAVQAALQERAVLENRRAWRQRGAVGAGLGSVLLIALVRVRRSRRMSPVAETYARVLRFSEWAGFGPGSATTPMEAAGQLAEHLPAQRQPLHTVAEAYTAERYALSTKVATSEVEQAWRAIRWPMIGALLRRPWRSRSVRELRFHR
jgi:hypothetical protein